MGQVDLTTNVDFGSLLRVLERQYADGVRAHGPVTQAEFLASMGIGERLGALIDQPDVTDEQAEVLFESFKRLVDDKQVCRALTPAASMCKASPPFSSDTDGNQI